MIFLTSSVGSIAPHLFENFLKEEGFSTLLFIDTAAEPAAVTKDGDGWLQRDIQSLKDVGYQVDCFSVTDKNIAEIEQALDTHDIIYMSGGDTSHLLKQLHATGAFELIKERVASGKTYIGTSAGSIVAGPSLPEYFIEEDREVGKLECLGFVNFTLVPHWGDEYFKERYIGQRLESVYSPDQVPFLLLNDRQYVQVLADGAIKIHTRD